MKCIPSLERMDDGERGKIARILEVNRGENFRLISLSVILAVLGCSTLALAFVVASSSKARSSPFNVSPSRQLTLILPVLPWGGVTRSIKVVIIYRPSPTNETLNHVLLIWFCT